MYIESAETRTRRRSILLMVLCASLWSIAGILIKLIPWNPFVIAGFRSLLAAGVIFVYMRAKRIRLIWNRQAVLAGLSLSATYLAFVTANKLTTSANAIVLQFTAPVFIILLSTLFWGQKYRKSDYFVVAATVLGISLCFLGQLETGSLLGNVIGLFSGLAMAAMFATTGNTDSASRMSGLLYGQLLTAAIGMPVALFTETPVTTPAVVSIVILGVFQLGIPYLLYAAAVEHCSPLVCCLISAVEPLLNPLWVFLFHGETPGVFSLIGGAVVIGTITVWNLWNERLVSQKEPYEQTP